LTQVESAGSYECTTPVEQWMTGTPLGRTDAERIVQLGEEFSNGSTDMGGNAALCVFTFLITLHVNTRQSIKREKPSPGIKLTRTSQDHQTTLASFHDRTWRAEAQSWHQPVRSLGMWDKDDKRNDGPPASVRVYIDRAIDHGDSTEGRSQDRSYNG
jgi:hypothetical protein